LPECAVAQDGKRFALQRLGLPLPPFRPRGPLRTRFVGKPHGGCQRTYFCSELVCEACVAAGLLDPERTRPSATYPHDPFFGRSCNLFIYSHLDVNQWWGPPGRWIDCPAQGVEVRAIGGRGTEGERMEGVPVPTPAVMGTDAAR